MCAAALFSPSSSSLLSSSSSASAFVVTPTTKPALSGLSHYGNTIRLYSQNNKYGGGGGSRQDEESNIPPLKRFDKIQVEVTRFGHLGASVGIIAAGSHDPEDCIPEDEDFLAQGLILQREIHYFRAARDGLDVVVGEIIPAYVENVREDGKIDVCLRDPGGKGKAESVGKAILDKLQTQPGGLLHVGDKSSPEEINAAFPGVSKSAFKKAVAALYKKKLVQPGPTSIELMSKK